MGFSPSPYLASRWILVGIEFGTKGDPSIPPDVRMNLPGSDNYDPQDLRVAKVDHLGRSTGEIVVYVDDGRVFGRDEAHTMVCLRKCCSRLEWLGIQDAKHKRRPGAWAGGVIYTDQSCKLLLEGRGFLVYALMTYTFITPFLKGLHLSVENWRPNRDEDDWKVLPHKEGKTVPSLETEPDGWEDHLEDLKEVSGLDEIEMAAYIKEEFDLELDAEAPKTEDSEQEENEERPPNFARASPRVASDLVVLSKLLERESPLMVPLRPNGTISIVYGFGDASEEGLGRQLC
eukprot:scaffold305_cov60-Attheya_sp.AAC.4